MKLFKKKIDIEIDKEIIALSISQAEEKVNAEFVPIVFKQSDNYPGAHFRLALTLIFLSTALLYYFPFPWKNPVWYLWIQVPASIVGYFFAFRPNIKRLFSTGTELDEEVRQKAIELFFEKGLHLTKNHNCILIYVSLLEKRIQIIPDALFWKDIPEKKWDKIINHMSRIIKKEGLTTGITKSIDSITKMLIDKYPKIIETSSDDSNVISNELTNTLILEEETT